MNSALNAWDNVDIVGDDTRLATASISGLSVTLTLQTGYSWFLNSANDKLIAFAGHFLRRGAGTTTPAVPYCIYHALPVHDGSSAVVMLRAMLPSTPRAALFSFTGTTSVLQSGPVGDATTVGNIFHNQLGVKMYAAVIIFYWFN